MWFYTTPTYPIHPYRHHAAAMSAGSRWDRTVISLKTCACHPPTWPTQLLIVSYPHNPPLKCQSQIFEKIVAYAKEHGSWSFMTFPMPTLFLTLLLPVFLQVKGAKEVGVEFFSLSKSYNMPGWRHGVFA
jgi:alanine-synthesizing transaminase